MILRQPLASEGSRCEWRRHQVPRTAAPRIHGSRIMGRHLRYNLSCTEYPAGKYNYAGDATLCSSLMCLACSDATVCSRVTRVKERVLNITNARRASVWGRTSFSPRGRKYQFDSRSLNTNYALFKTYRKKISSE